MAQTDTAPLSVDHTRTARRWTLGVVCVAVFMLLLDVTIVAVALGDIQQDLGADLAGLQWVIDAYTLSLACLLLTAATIGDRIGRLKVFAAGLALFTAASLGCALAGSIEVLNGLRAVQGVGGAMLFGTALPLIGAAFPTKAERAKAIGLFGATVSGAAAVGPLVGGALVDGLGWQWIFLVNVPIGLLALLSCRRLSDSRADVLRRADWPGTVLLTGWLATALVALIRGQDDGWTSGVILGLFAASGVLFAGFVLWEKRTPQPMLDLRLFGRREFAGVGLGAFALSGTLIGATTYIALFLQNGLGFTPFGSGLRVLPLTVASFVAAPVAAMLYQRLGSRILISGSMLLTGVGMLLASLIGGDSSWVVLLPGLVVAGVGLGIGMAASSSAALDSVEASLAGMATGAVNTLRQVGTATGVAVLGVVFSQTAQGRTGDLLAGARLPAGAPETIADAVGSGAGIRVLADLPASLPDAARTLVADTARIASADALSAIMLGGGAVALIAALATWLLMRPRSA